MKEDDKFYQVPELREPPALSGGISIRQEIEEAAQRIFLVAMIHGLDDIATHGDCWEDLADARKEAYRDMARAARKPEVGPEAERS